MEVTISRHHYRDFSIDEGTVFEEHDMDLSELWDKHVVKPQPDVYKPFSDLSDDTKTNLKRSVTDQACLEGKTFYDIDDWNYHFGDNSQITYDTIDGDGMDVEDHEIQQIMTQSVRDLKDSKIFDIYLNPLFHAVQSEVEELKARRELRKVKANKLIEHIQLSLEKSLKKYDEEIESKIFNSVQQS